ncbi:hypothetical protein [Nocardia terpenica]|uniref:Uncharacterized protein n=1 Tax=Nocardia terpenica TaxID=455432 RepID=A0A164NQF4_9NOCA|nr:hypothetical protein [Nocardia terpenica]KZM74607.1 hypothetical protein AWN90_21225 [Nocardia terpenica]NQE93806.1 hypothetical protein [Nocardia terpenica]
MTGDRLHPHLFVTADSRFAEVLCGVEFLGPLTRTRAQQLHALHRNHPPDDCLVRLASLTRLAADDEPTRTQNHRPA